MVFVWGGCGGVCSWGGGGGGWPRGGGGGGDPPSPPPAVIVTITSQASGVSVTQAKRARPILMRIVVPTHNATAASSWFEIPNRGQREVIPPKGSTTPW